MVAELAPASVPARAPWRSTVRLWGANGRALISADYVARLGSPEYLTVRTNGDRALIGLSAYSPRDDALLRRKLSGHSGGAKLVSLIGAVEAIGRAWPPRTLPLPHSWIADTLLLDCSGLPLAEGNDGR